MNSHIIIAAIILLLTHSCSFDPQSEPSTFKSLPRKRVRNELCGVEKHVARADPLCGTVYRLAETSHCPIKTYHSRQDPRCEGYKPARYRKLESGGHCEPDEKLVAVSKPGFHDIEPGYVFYCDRPEIIPTCARPEFGAATYHECRHQNHGIEYFHTCENQAFGVALYRECELLLTLPETQQWLNTLKTDAAFHSHELLRHKGMYFLATEQQAAIHSFIKQLLSNKAYHALASQLEAKYKTTFYLDGRDQSNKHVKKNKKKKKSSAKNSEPASDNNATATVGEIPSQNCDKDKETLSCQILESYLATKSWLQARDSELTQLQSDLAAMSNEQIRVAIQQQKQAIAQTLQLNEKNI